MPEAAPSAGAFATSASRKEASWPPGRDADSHIGQTTPAQWGSFARGLRCLQVSFILFILLEVVSLTGQFNQPAGQPGAGDAEVVAGVAALLLLVGSVVLWVIGRALCVRRLNESIQGLARASLVLTLISVGFLIVTIIALVNVLAQMNARWNGAPRPGEPQSVIMVFGCGTLLFVVAGLVAELLCQRLLWHVARQFRDERLRRLAQGMFIATWVVLAALALLVSLAAIGGVEEARQAQLNPNAQPMAPVQDENEALANLVFGSLTTLYLGFYFALLQRAKSIVQGKHASTLPVLREYGTRREDT